MLRIYLHLEPKTRLRIQSIDFIWGWGLRNLMKRISFNSDDFQFFVNVNLYFSLGTDQGW